MHRLFYIFCLLCFISCSNKKPHVLEAVNEIRNFPSASGIEYLNKQLYVVGDDATHLIVLDTNFTTRDSIILYPYSGKRIDKATKPDLEAISSVRSEQRNKLFAIGSGSLAPYRNQGWLIDPFRNAADSFRMDSFYLRLRQLGLKEINIEGMASIPGTVLFSNRGNKAWPHNHIIVTTPRFWEFQGNTSISLINCGTNSDTSTFAGISGMGYAATSDWLFLTASTEDTRSSTEDGAIGKSYLWIIKSIVSKQEWEAINPNTIIDLESIDSRFKGHKIESVTVLRETRKTVLLALAADNDDGSSTLFRLLIQKNRTN
jgi:hypothetical protein